MNIYIYISSISICISLYIQYMHIHFAFVICTYATHTSSKQFEAKASGLGPLPSLQVGTAGNATSENLCWVAELQGPFFVGLFSWRKQWGLRRISSFDGDEFRIEVCRFVYCHFSMEWIRKPSRQFQIQKMV